MKRALQLLLAGALISGLMACSQNQADSNASAADKPDIASSAKAVMVKTTIPEGAKLHVALIDGVSTTNSTEGEEFMASLSEPVIVDGKTVLDKGTKVKGHVTDVEKSGHIKGRASIRLILTEVVHDGKDVSISTKPYVAVAQGTKKRDAEIIGGGAGIGALIGGLAGGGKGALIGAGVGGGAGTGTVIAIKGKEIHYPPETKLSFTLASPVTI